MKLHLMSDMHFEFGWRLELVKHAGVILVLAGDIDNNLERLEGFILDALVCYDKVIMVAGNHEFYGHELEDVIDYLRTLDDDMINFHFLENDKLVIHDVTFLGATLWATPGWGVFKRIADHHQIKLNGKMLNGEDIAGFNRVTTDFLKQELEANKDNKTVVITHFGPDERLMHPKWAAMSELNTYFWAQGLEDHFKYADHWMFGHTHDPGGGKIDGCTFHCNPHGYVFNGEKEHNGFIPEMIIEV